uniref:DNA helicase Pif1-like 2B domain-containing protein n=1 Tax=Tetranychus urticae TaxID=32264 RepID=T1JZN2_TETUR
MLVRNISINLGLVNGLQGIITNVHWPIPG